MKLAVIPALLAFISLASFQDNSMKLLYTAKDKINTSKYIGYHYEAHWPDPVGKINVLSGHCTFRANNNTFLDYDYIGTSPDYDFIYLNNKYTRVNHDDSTVLRYTDAETVKQKSAISENLFIVFSPITQLNKSNWMYVQDTIMQQEKFSDYRIIEMDTTINENKIYVEIHLFINQSSALAERFERRAFLNGKSSQVIIYSFTDFVLDETTTALVYDYPSGYKSRMNSDREKITLLKEGQEAPDLKTKDINGNDVDLKPLRGQKVLLNFSVINCGYCKLALDHFNRDDFKLPDELVGIYINPQDTPADVSEYADKIHIPFPAVGDAKAIGKLYGVSGYPTFFLIDEKGVIEKVVVGYRPEFIDSLSKRAR